MWYVKIKTQNIAIRVSKQRNALIVFLEAVSSQIKKLKKIQCLHGLLSLQAVAIKGI